MYLLLSCSLAALHSGYACTQLRQSPTAMARGGVSFCCLLVGAWQRPFATSRLPVISKSRPPDTKKLIATIDKWNRVRCVMRRSDWSFLIRVSHDEDHWSQGKIHLSRPWMEQIVGKIKVLRKVADLAFKSQGKLPTMPNGADDDNVGRSKSGMQRPTAPFSPFCGRSVVWSNFILANDMYEGCYHRLDSIWVYTIFSCLVKNVEFFFVAQLRSLFSDCADQQVHISLPTIAICLFLNKIMQRGIAQFILATCHVWDSGYYRLENFSVNREIMLFIGKPKGRSIMISSVNRITAAWRKLLPCLLLGLSF